MFNAEDAELAEDGGVGRIFERRAVLVGSKARQTGGLRYGRRGRLHYEVGRLVFGRGGSFHRFLSWRARSGLKPELRTFAFG